MRAFGSLAGLSNLFGGHMSFGHLFSSNEYLGVWGHRNASRFRRVLREHLGEIEIVHAPPPARFAGAEINNSRPTRLERDTVEGHVKQSWTR